MELGEVVRQLNGIGEKIEEDRRAQAYFAYGTALAVGSFIASIFGSTSPPQISDIFPGYFKNDAELEAERRMQKSAENFIKFANEHNRKCED